MPKKSIGLVLIDLGLKFFEFQRARGRGIYLKMHEIKGMAADEEVT